jgi:DNA-damage-inducible protein J
MDKTATVRARIKPELKDRAEQVFRKLGINATQAIVMFYKQVELRDGLPFDVVIPNKTTLRTLEDTDAGRNLVICKSEEEMFRQLGI